MDTSPVSAVPVSRTQTLAEGEAAVGARWERTVGSRLGRYVIEERLGAGAMGVVYGAYDPELGRKVAIKLAHPSQAEKRRGAERFVREARAMAALDHPHVVALYDFGIRDGEAFLVMQRVQAQTLTEWLASAPPRQERLRLMLEAGRGLAAAHAAGLVHRDFKPDNVLVTRSLHAKVTDFGLARAYGDREDSDGSSTPILRSGGMSQTVTARGVVIGSPAYMSVEQHRAELLTPRSDQYSYCVALCEVLTGERPFEARSVTGLLQRKEEGPRRGVGRTLPVHIAKALRRGLSPRPQDRFANMSALLHALQHGPTRGRWWASAAAAVVALPVVLGSGEPAESGPERCSSAEALRREIWGPRRQAGVGAVFDRSSSPHALASRGRVMEILDAQIETWTDTYLSACVLAGAERDAAMVCLSRHRDAFTARVDELIALENTSIDGAVEAVNDLEDPRVCLQPVAARLDAAKLEPRTRSFLTEIRRRKAAAKEAMRVGDMFAARAELVQAVEAVDRLEPTELRVQPLRRIGDLLDTAGAPELAHVELLRALEYAREARDDKGAAGAAIYLAWVDGVSLQRTEQGRHWATEAEILMTRFEPEPEMALARLMNLAAIYKVEGDLDGAMELLLEGRRVVDAGQPSSTAAERNALLLKRAALDHNIGTMMYWRGEHAAALEAFESCVEATRASLGDDHPDVVESLEGVVYAAEALGRLELARDNALDMVRIVRSNRGAAHPSMGRAVNAVVAVDYALGDLEAVQARLEGAIAELEQERPEDMQRFSYMVELAAAAREQGDPERAWAVASESYEAFEEFGNPEFAGARAGALREMAMSASELGRHETALELLERTEVAADGTSFGLTNELVMQLTRTHLLHRAERHEEAVRAGRRGMALARDAPESVDAQLMLMRMAESLADRAQPGDREEAEALLAELQGWIDAATGDRSFVRGELAELREELAGEDESSSNSPW